jgi:AraC-like DNA-binding protein
VYASGVGRGRRSSGDALAGTPVSMRMLVPFGLACRSRGIDPAALLTDVGIPLGAFLDFDGVTTHGAYAAMFEHAEARSKDPAFGLHAAEHIEFGMFLALDQETPWLAAQAFATSATVGDGVRRFARAIPGVHAAARYEIARDEVHDDAIAIRYSLAGGVAPPRGMVELAFGIASGMLKAFPREPVSPIAVRFAHLRGGELDDYRRVLRTTPEFERPRDEMVISASDWEMPLRTSRPALAARLEERLAAIRSESGDAAGATTLREHAMRLLADELVRGSPTAERLAERLGISVRTLHRRLREEGTTHRQLLDQLRKERAYRLLVDEGVTVRETTIQLGFSEPAALKRAVKRWFGKSPAALRSSI